MGLTLIQRSAGRPVPRKPRIALVLAGGAITGGAFKVGGLKALDECLVGRKVNELDTYVGLSAGAFLATSLAGGITPDEMVGALDGTSEHLQQMRPIDFYFPNVGEMIGRSAMFSWRLASYMPGMILDLLSVLPDLPSRLRPHFEAVVERPSYTHLESLLMALYDEVSPKREFPSLSALLPSGLFDNAALERWLASQMAAVGMPNSFAEFYRESGRKLFITATNLDTAERVVFGPANDHGLTISQSVQASSALPGFFKPARFNGVDYIDGGVRRTANIDVAVEEGADLVICYNPFRPFLNDPTDKHKAGPAYLADRGFMTVINQTFRTLLHTRLELGLRSYLNDDRFRGDIVVIQARETDEQFFDLNPLEFWKRNDAIRHGLESVRRTLRDSADVLEPVFGRYGLEFKVPEGPLDAMDETPAESEPSRRLLRVAG